MRLLFVLASAIAVSYGDVQWNDFRARDVSLPTHNVKAIQSGKWKAVEKDDTLRITWYSQDDDPRFLIGYDDRMSPAGVRVAFLKSDIDPGYIDVYKKSGIFEEDSCHGKEVFYSTVLFTSENILKKGGRRMLPTDEVAMGVYIKTNGKYKRVSRDGCELANAAFVEQGCQSGYGLVFSKFGSTSKCDYLTPFYTIYDPEETGNLIAFGWLSFSKFSEGDFRTTTFYKTIPQRTFKALFPHAPDCLTAYSAKGLTSVEVWMSYRDGQKTVCAPGDWTVPHCQTRSITRSFIGNF